MGKKKSIDDSFKSFFDSKAEALNPNSSNYVGDELASQVKNGDLDYQVLYYGGGSESRSLPEFDNQKEKDGDSHTYGYPDEYWED